MFRTPATRPAGRGPARPRVRRGVRGSLPTARRFLDEAMALYEGTTTSAVAPGSQHNLAWVAFLAGDVADAERQLHEACQRFERARRPGRRRLGATVCSRTSRTSSAASTRPRSWPTTSRSRPAGGATSWARLMMQTLLAEPAPLVGPVRGGRVATPSGRVDRVPRGRATATAWCRRWRRSAGRGSRWASRRRRAGDRGARARPVRRLRRDGLPAASPPPAWRCTSATPSRRSCSPARWRTAASNTGVANSEIAAVLAVGLCQPGRGRRGAGRARRDRRRATCRSVGRRGRWPGRSPATPTARSPTPRWRGRSTG